MRRSLAIIFLLLIQVTSVAAERIVYKGDRPKGARTIERLFRQAVARTADSAEGLLRSRGYLDARVEVDSDQIIVAAGPLYRLDSVYLAGDVDGVIASGDVFTDGTVRDLIENMLDRLYEQGYYWATAKIEAVHKKENRVMLAVQVRKGPVVQLAATSLVGLSRTNPDVVTRSIPVVPGDTLTERVLREAETAADRLDFVTFHPPAAILPREGFTLADLQLRFSEKRQFTFEGGAGYWADKATGLVWHLRFQFNNLFGGGRRATMLSERRQRGRNVLRLGYSQPLFLAGAGRAEVDVGTRDYREQFYEFLLRGSYSARISSVLDVGLQLDWKSVEPVGDRPAYSRFGVGFSVTGEAVDSRPNPSSGIRFHWEVTYAYRRYHEDSLAAAPEHNSLNETRAATSIEWFRPLAGRLIGRLCLNYLGLETNETLPPLSELFPVGGPGTVRGFRNEQFVALRTAYGSVEPRIRFSSGYLFAFYDAAYVNNRVSVSNGSPRTDERFYNGFGLGLALYDRYKSVTVSLGWNPDVNFDQPRLSVEFSSDI